MQYFPGVTSKLTNIEETKKYFILRSSMKSISLKRDA